MKHDEIAWGHCLAQFSGSLKLEALVRSLYAPLNALQTAYDDLLTVRHLDKAEGVQLDGIGQIVGLPREVDAVLFAQFFGFDGQSGILSFNKARIRREHEKNVQGGIVLDDGQYRRLLHWTMVAARRWKLRRRLRRCFWRKKCGCRIGATRKSACGFKNRRQRLRRF